MSIGTRIKQKRLEQKLTLLEVANAIGVQEATVQRYESGIIKTLKQDTIAKLANVLNTTPSFLMGWDSVENCDNLTFNNLVSISKKRFPVLGEIACGKPIVANEQRELYIEVGTDVQADFCLIAKGDSMINARIQDGDIIFVQACEMVENGEIGVVVIDDQATLKRVYYDREKGQLILSAENPLYPPLIFTGEDLNSIRILGRAVGFQSSLK